MIVFQCVNEQIKLMIKNNCHMSTETLIIHTAILLIFQSNIAFYLKLFIES